MIQLDRYLANEIAGANHVTVAKLGLRFDRVVVRLLGNIRLSVEQNASKNVTVLMTLTAPIQRPAKTETSLLERIHDMLESGIQHQDHVSTVCQNAVRLRIVPLSSRKASRFVGFVHNPVTDSRALLDLCTQWLLKIG